MGAKVKSIMPPSHLMGFLYIRHEYDRRECYTGLQVLNWGVSFLTKAEPTANSRNPHSSLSLCLYTVSTTDLSIFHCSPHLMSNLSSHSLHLVLDQAFFPLISNICLCSIFYNAEIHFQENEN